MKKQLIDADALIRFMNERHKTLVDESGWYDHYTSGYEDAITDVEEAPIVDAEPVRHGRWEWHEDDWCYVCSCCNCSFDYDKTYLLFDHGYEYASYCPNCGAKMDGGAE